MTNNGARRTTRDSNYHASQAKSTAAGTGLYPGRIDFGRFRGQGSNRVARLEMSSKPSTPRWPSLAVALVLGACGSRTGLDVDPTYDAGTVTPGVPDDAAVLGCFLGSRAIGEIPIDLYFALDKSRSMATIDPGSTTTRWAAVSAAMNTFINAPLSAGLGAGIGFFPRVTPNGDTYCTTADYAFPVVPIGTLPGVAPSIVRAISLQQLANGTPTAPALDGAHVYARSRQAGQPSHTAAVVLVTDGFPRGCASNTVASTSAVAASAVAGIPPVKTYVLGVGPNLINLNAIAQAGGTTQAYLVASSGEASLLAALEAIRTSALTCEYPLPLTSAQMPRLDIVKVATRTGDGAPPTTVDQVANAEACAGGPGWFYDNAVSSGGPPPTKITLCPTSCSPLVQGTGNGLDVTFGCVPAALPLRAPRAND
jgi:hypothetical protein